MSKVGSDQRLNYYQMSGDAVVAELRSHAYGLTNPEAARRVSQNGLNRLRAEPRRSLSHLVIQQCQNWLVGLLAICLGLAWYLGNAPMAWFSLGVLLAMVLLAVWREYRPDNLTYNLDRLLAERATVHRNGQDADIDALELALGDMVRLSAGDRVPADLRLIDTDGLIMDDTPLFGGDGHTPKFAHTLAGNLPVQQRGNLAFLGTSVVSGSGTGVVVATGMTTELGHLVGLASALPPKSSRLQAQFRQLSARLATAALAIAIAISVAAVYGGLSLHRSLTVLLTLAAALAPAGLLLAVSWAYAAFSQRRTDVHINNWAVIDRLPSADVLLLDDTNLLVEARPVAHEFLIGKRTFRAEGSGYDSTGKLLGERGKAASSKTLGELSLFFETAALTSHTRLLPPDAEHDQWHIAGKADEGALTALAQKSGQDPETLKAAHPLLRDWPFDHQRNLSTQIRRYDHRQMVFVHGSTAAVLAHTERLWDAGHTRKLSAADQKRLAAYIDEQTGRGNHCLALAYRPLTAREKPDSLSLAAAERSLILLGIVVVGQPIRHQAVLALQAARAHGAGVSILSERPAAVSLAAANQLGLDARLLSSSDLAKLSDDRLLEYLQAGGLVLHSLSPEQRLRLVHVAEEAGLGVAVSGSSLAALPALRRATVALATSKAIPAVRQEADLTLVADDLHALTRTLSRAARFSANLLHSSRAALTGYASGAWLVIIGTVLLLAWHIPLAVTALQLLLGGILLAFPLAATSRDKSVERFAGGQLSPQLAYHSGWSRLVFGGLAAGLVCLNFLFFFARVGLSPDYIDPASGLYAQAATLGLVGLTLCGWINLLYIRAEKLPTITRRQLWHNPWLAGGFAANALLLVGFVYLPNWQSFAGTQELSLADWATALLLAILYAAIRWIGHAERQHSRHAVIELHREIHGHDSPSQV